MKYSELNETQKRKAISSYRDYTEQHFNEYLGHSDTVAILEEDEDLEFDYEGVLE